MRSCLIRSLVCLAALALAWPLSALSMFALSMSALSMSGLSISARAQDAQDAGLSIAVAPDGAIRASGMAPPGFTLRELAGRVPGIDLSAARDGASGEAETWSRVLDAISVVLPRMAEGELRIAADRLDVEGRLRPGFNAEATRGAVRLALGSDREVRLAIAEAPPPAALAVTFSRQGAAISGILPDGLAPADALALVGGPVEGLVEDGLADAGITGGGDGDPAAWRAALARVGRLLTAYRSASVQLGPGSVSVDGALMPGHEVERLDRWMTAGLGAGWEVSIHGVETPAREGAIRLDPVSGRSQEQVRDRWIPIHAFTPSPAACGRRSRIALADEPLTFLAGTVTLTEGAAETLDRLAGIARRCLNDGGLTLEIGGHTDSVGAAEENQALSEKRAMAVLLELVDRGVRADAMRAVGFGEIRAIAGNDTEEGRARNRRITFGWSE